MAATPVVTFAGSADGLFLSPVQMPRTMEHILPVMRVRAPECQLTQ